VPEFAFGVREFYIFGCNEGKYETLLKHPPDNYYSPDSIVEIKDANRDGIPEITLLTGYLTQRGHYYQVYEWDGSRFRNLLVSDRPEYPESGAIYVMASGTVTYQDLDGDGVQELIANRGIPIWEIYSSGLPWRNERQYFKWDGTHFAFYTSELDPPQYRFQAIQDGDKAALVGNYDKALDLYQQAIFSDQLEWWSPERRENMQVLYASSFASDPTPTPPAPDPNEYYHLAAYARYRIMLLHVLRGYLPEAQVVYDTLQEKFPAGNVGHAYAEMATAFWTEYQSSQNFRQACAKAIAYARANSEMLIPLGSDYHGWQSRWYKPEDVCPFK
jgi:hypothetical protein